MVVKLKQGTQIKLDLPGLHHLLLLQSPLLCYGSSLLLHRLPLLPLVDFPLF